MKTVRRELFSLLAAFVSIAGNLESAPQSMVPWTFRADFQHGFCGWMSFPLPQDIGFDPTLSVEKEDGAWDLIREVTSAGQKRLTLGFSRPLHFIARPEMHIRLRYRTAVAAASAHLRLILAGEDGHRYETDIPSSAGLHDIGVSGRQLAIAGGDIPVEAVVLEGVLDAPRPILPNRIVLQEFELAAFRIPEVPVLSPTLLDENSDREIRVAALPLSEGDLLTMKLGSHSPLTVKLTDPQGKTEPEKDIPASATPSTYTLAPCTKTGLWTADISGKEAHTRFSFLVLEKAGPHPRTLLSDARLLQLANIRQQIHNQAHSPFETNSSAGANIQHLPPGKSLRAEYDGELTPYFQLLDSYSNAIAFCALDYALSGDRTSLEAAKRNLLAVAQWSTWTPPRFASHGMHTYYEVGVFAQKVALGYDLIATQLTQTERDQISKGFWKNIIEPTVDEYFRFNRLPLAASNWMANSSEEH